MLQLITAFINSAVRWCSGQSEQYTDGNEAYYSGKSEESNPEAHGTEAWREWRRGYFGN